MSRRVFSGGRVTGAASRVSVLDFISVPKATITQRPRLFQGGSGSSARLVSKSGALGADPTPLDPRGRGGCPHCPLVPDLNSPLWGSGGCPPAIFFKLFKIERFVLRVAGKSPINSVA